MLFLSKKGRWRNNPAPFIFFSSAFFLLFNDAAIAQTVQRLSVKELEKESDVIVRGRVQKISSQQSPDRSNITTHIELNVIEQWKGPKRSSLIVSQPGGSAGAITQSVPGLARFSSGEEAIFFLRQIDNSHFEIVGGRQGKFPVKTDLKTREEFIQDVTGKRESLGNFLNRLRAAQR